MRTQQFTPEAVRQLVERGYSVAEIAARLGVSTHSLYKLVSAAPLINQRAGQRIARS
jgi:transposase